MILARSLFASALVFLTVLSVQAQVPGPGLVKMSNLAFGWVSMSGVDPTLDMLSSFAPTMLCLRDAGFPRGGEAVNGAFTFGDLTVDANFQSTITSVGPGAARISHYGFNSNTGQIQGMPGALVHTNGDAIELSYAQHVGEATVGISLVPKDDTTLSLYHGDTMLATGDVSTKYGARVGGVVPLGQGVKFGADYSYQRDAGTMRLSPALTGSTWVDQQDDFITRCGTVGFSLQAGPKTTIYSSYQKLWASGSTLPKDTADMVWFGVQHKLTDSLAVGTNYLDGGANVMVQWRTRYGLINAAYTHNALRNARFMLGDGNSAFIGIDLAM